MLEVLTHINAMTLQSQRANVAAYAHGLPDTVCVCFSNSCLLLFSKPHAVYEI